MDYNKINQQYRYYFINQSLGEYILVINMYIVYR